MQLNRIDDPRDSLAKARRSELVIFARQNNVKDIDPNMPADLIRHKLRTMGLTRIQIPTRILGQPNQPHGNARVSASNAPVIPTSGVEIGAMADLERQWRQESAAPAPKAEAPSLKNMGINELRSLGKSMGIKFERTDNMPKMRIKIEAKRNAQDAS